MLQRVTQTYGAVPVSLFLQKFFYKNKNASNTMYFGTGCFVRYCSIYQKQKNCTSD